MACHTVRAVGWHPEEEEGGEGWIGELGGGHFSQSASRHQERASERERDRGEGLWWETDW